MQHNRHQANNKHRSLESCGKNKKNMYAFMQIEIERDGSTRGFREEIKLNSSTGRTHGC